MHSGEVASRFPPWRKELKMFGSLSLPLWLVIFVGASIGPALCTLLHGWIDMRNPAHCSALSAADNQHAQ